MKQGIIICLILFIMAPGVEGYHLLVRYNEGKMSRVSMVAPATGARIESATLESQEIRRVGKALVRSRISSKPILSAATLAPTLEVLIPSDLTGYTVEDVSADGQIVLLARADVEETAEIYLFDRVDGSFRAITEHKTAACFLPRFSPDGSWVCYYLYPDALDPRDPDLQRMTAAVERSHLWYANELQPLNTNVPGYGLGVAKVDGSESFLLAPVGNIFIGSLQRFPPQWSPDGKHILFLNTYYDAEGRMEPVLPGMHVISVSTGAYRRLNSEDTASYHGCWYPDSAGIAAVIASPHKPPYPARVVRYTLEGREETLYAFNEKAGINLMAIDPTGKLLFVLGTLGRQIEGFDRHRPMIGVMDLSTLRFEDKPFFPPKDHPEWNVVDFWFSP